MIDTSDGGRGGMFTTSNPEDRRITPADKNGRASFKVREAMQARDCIILLPLRIWHCGRSPGGGVLPNPERGSL